MDDLFNNIFNYWPGTFTFPDGDLVVDETSVSRYEPYAPYSNYPQTVTTLTVSATPYFTHASDEPMLPEIKDVIFNPPATIVLWKDGTKTVVKCGHGDTYSKEIGLAMAICKKAYGNKGAYNDVFNKWLSK